jgi:hypothetical protein
VEDEARMRDLAYLSMARTYYSASVRLDDNNVPTIDSTKLSAAVKYWNRSTSAASTGSTALFEQSWAYFMAGDYPHALGNIHTIESPYFPNSFYPEADILKAVISFTICQYEDATTDRGADEEEVRADQEGARGGAQPLQGRGRGPEVLRVPSGRTRGQGQPVADDQADRRERALRSSAAPQPRVRARARRGGGAFQEGAAHFRNSALGNDVVDALGLARDLAIRNAGTLARERYERNLDELNEHLRNASKILIDITAAERNKLDQEVVSGQLSKEEAQTYGVVSPTRSTSSGPSTASTGATSLASTARSSSPSAAPSSESSPAFSFGRAGPGPALDR